MRVLKRRASGLAVVLKNQNVLKAPVFLQVENPVAISPEHIFDPLGRKRSQSRVVIACFDNDFMRADAVHLVKHPLGLAIEITFNSESGKFIGNYAHGPSLSIALRRATVLAGTIGLDF